MSSRIFRQIRYPVLCAMTVACASQSGEEVQDAHHRHQAKQDALASEQTKLDQDQAGEQAELEHGQVDSQADLKAEKRAADAESGNDIATARADLKEEQEEFAADADKRIQKADAQASEARVKSRALSAKKRVRFDSAWNEYKSKREAAVEQTHAAQGASSQEWLRAKPEAERCLVRLEASVNDVDKVF